MNTENQNKILKEGMEILLGKDLFDALWRDDISGVLFKKALEDIKKLKV